MNIFQRVQHSVIASDTKKDLNISLNLIILRKRWNFYSEVCAYIILSLYLSVLSTVSFIAIGALRVMARNIVTAVS